MNRNQYDSDITTWSPQGRIFQIEYAMEAVKQGSPCLGLKSRTHAVLCALRRGREDLGAHQNKIFRIDDHVGISISGLTADARILSKFMRTECMSAQYVYAAPVQVGRLVRMVADKAQANTQRAGRRPFGVGLLVVGFDQTGPHLFETSPSGLYHEFVSQSIGARAQSARTYLEKHFETFAGLSRDDLIVQGLLALREATQSGGDGLTGKNCSVGVVGKDEPFAVIQGDDLQPFLDRIDAGKAEEDEEGEEGEDDAEMADAGAGAGAGAGASAGAAGAGAVSGASAAAPEEKEGGPGA